MKLRPRSEVFCFRGNKVLCGLRTDYVLFPGGGIDPNESAVDAAVRETMEEADRKLTDVRVAHPPTMQKWPEGYTKEAANKWAKGYQGGLTYWLSGKVGRNPLHPVDERHEDYEKSFEWLPIKEVLQHLHRDLTGDWQNDAEVRRCILQEQLNMNEPQKIAAGIPDVELRLANHRIEP